MNSELAKNIHNWYIKNGRKFPWREKINSVYEIMIAEILLQRTTAKNVEKFYPIFLKKFPNLSELKKASINDLEQILKNMGLLKKAIYLKEIAEELEKKNYQFPDNKSDLMKLKGIGDYISSAIMTFGFNENTPIVDSNIKRFAQRFWKINNIEDIKKNLFVLTKNNFREIYFGLLDICWYFCKAPIPRCDECPLRQDCLFFKKENSNYF